MKNGKNPTNIPIQYPDRESNSELSFRRALLYPFNYQGYAISGAKVQISKEKTKFYLDFSLQKKA